jgi:hypothetical protein
MLPMCHFCAGAATPKAESGHALYLPASQDNKRCSTLSSTCASLSQPLEGETYLDVGTCYLESTVNYRLYRGV